MKNLLPLGSVVLVKEATKSLIIVGTRQKDNEGKKYDYVACLFPEGYINAEMFFLFNHEDIEKVRFVGYIDSEVQVYEQKIRELEENGKQVW